MVCKGVCERYKAQKPIEGGRYASGQRRCQICELFIKWEGLWCPCCEYRLRTKPRNKKYKEKLRSHQAKSEKTPCTYCEKLFVNPKKHEVNCKKKPIPAE